jgi:DnaJ-class molecular chaperone
MPRKPPSLIDELSERLHQGIVDFAADFIEDTAQRFKAETQRIARTLPGSQPQAQPQSRGERAQSRPATKPKVAAPTHYETLGVHPKAPLEVISASYKALSKMHHPDVWPSRDRSIKESDMKRINQAYSVLKDKEKRNKYDQMLARTP